MKKNFLTSVAFALALGLVACGDDSGSNSGTNGVKGEVIALADGSGEKVCDDKLEGWVAEAVGKDFRRCQNGEWTKITASEASAEDEIIGGVTVLQSSSSETIPGSSSSVKAPEQVDASSSSVTLSDSDIESSGTSSPYEFLSSAEEGSSSSVTSSSSVESSSSVVSSSSEKSSSSVASSSSAKSSSSVASSSSAESSSSSVILSSSSEESSIKDGSEYNASANTLTDLRDGQVYKTVTIGTQTWMAENLNYAYKGVKFKYSGYTSDSTSWCYENKASNCDKYGRLYTWSAVMDSAAQFIVNAGTRCGYRRTCIPHSPHRGICPEGWHVPTNEEYNTLYTYIGGSSTVGSLLKSTSGWNNGYNGKSGNGTDKIGFSVLPAGLRGYSGDFDGEGYLASLWSASEDYSGDGYARCQFFSSNYDNANQFSDSKDDGLSLRCLKD